MVEISDEVRNVSWTKAMCLGILLTALLTAQDAWFCPQM